ncbi:ABC transporter ATP-binding protein [Ketogulonicigenium vulgare]|uniref:ABC transporter related protein n=1 Tax=Ketogulonicigenium vulgare (strain WSH-001) TaxID=759362 RepID=F9Y8P4_KETVW|nr:ABC transporter ATP-binding protein [Ketogulonicigenium vulgare]ADO43035.1 ABC transporter related protein [Ketogulonicigenium vulgare Y25]AEM41213.1 ABC transporter related protein [Ketogulonicigenium vulgare WSH-001]ALJ81355.1 ABC transporter ATP-binding protein [Ketogulonicigenium vulgare]ANW34087.1 ABC transporter ATP-binding protein [Ketogulonicigenium vulgare]AOZ54944.1 ABC transporter [Ketogulonicigenium vulgare]
MTVLLQVDGLKKQFGGLMAVNDLSFTVAEGEILALLGPNGSGKTTVMNLISGALPATAGRIQLDGVQISGLPAHRIARLGVARTFQLVRILPSLTVAENVIAALAFRAQPLWGDDAARAAEALLAEVGLAGRGGEYAADLTYIDQKRMELARALGAAPKLLLLDEWLSGLNPTELRVGIALILSLKARGMTIMLVEHIMEAVRALCPRTVVMNAGRKIADGPTNDVLADPAVVAAYLGGVDA